MAGRELKDLAAPCEAGFSGLLPLEPGPWAGCGVLEETHPVEVRGAIGLPCLWSEVSFRGHEDAASISGVSYWMPSMVSVWCAEF